VKPRAANQLASPSVETVSAADPAVVCSRAISTHLCVLICGRKRAPILLTRADMCAALRRTRATSSTSAGVGSSDKFIRLECCRKSGLESKRNLSALIKTHLLFLCAFAPLREN
jgi:hypothetical protein